MRILEANSIINSKGHRRGTAAKDQEFMPGWHRGADIASSSHVQNALLHCSFVKTLTNLTPLGPADGGTLVIPGS